MLQEKGVGLDEVDLVAPVRDKDFVPKPADWALSLQRFAAVKAVAAGSEDRARLLSETIEDLAGQNVLYCELRIGIKAEPTKRQYLDGLIEVISTMRCRFPGTTVKLLLSVARHSDVAYASENVDIAIE